MSIFQVQCNTYYDWEFKAMSQYLLDLYKKDFWYGNGDKNLLEIICQVVIVSGMSYFS